MNKGGTYEQDRNVKTKNCGGAYFQLYPWNDGDFFRKGYHASERERGL